MTYALHFAPRVGWLNDPNGLIQIGDVHHLFFQYNPFGLRLENIHWGHATSLDLLTWTERPVALVPADAGDYDRDGCWSGCAVRAPDGSVAVLYSGNRDGRQLPCLATSTDPDLITWVKAPGNPVIPAWPPIPGLTDFRDHSLARLIDSYRQVIAAGGKGGGQLVSYLSTGQDLTRWRWEGTLLSAREAGLPGEVWECPDVFELDGVVTVILSWYGGRPAGEVGGDVIWLTGDLTAGRFSPTRFGRLDTGDRFYAPQSYLTGDGQRIMFGWLRTQDDPASAGRDAVGAMSVPRSLSIVRGDLWQRPADEVRRLPRRAIATLSVDAPNALLRDADRIGHLEIVIAAEAMSDVGIALHNPDGERATIDLGRYLTPSTWVRRHDSWQAQSSHSGQAQILIDQGIIEIFFDDGRATAISDLRIGRISEIELTHRAGAAGEGASAQVFALDLPA